MQEKFEKVLTGEIAVEDLSDEEKTDFYKTVSEASQEKLKEYQGIKEARQAEQKKLEEAQEEAKRKEEEEERRKKEKEENKEPTEQQNNEPPRDERFDQFREEQKEKARQRLYSNIEVSDEDKSRIEEKFQRLDTGKVDDDLIYQDLLSAVAASKPEEYINALEEKKDKERQAEEYTKGEAGGSADTNPSEGDKSKFSDEEMNLAKEADISPEAARKQLREGHRRQYDF